jgi:hypothetical protein
MRLKLTRISLKYKVTLFFLLIVFLSSVGFRLILNKAQEKELLSQAIALSSGIENLFLFSQSAKGIWLENPVNARIISMIDSEKQNNLKLYRIHDPEFGKIIGSFFQHGAVIVLNFGIDEVKQFSSFEPTWSFEDNILTFKRPVVTNKSCVTCHNKMGASGFVKEGEISGSLTIRLLGQNFEEIIFDIVSPWNILAFILAIIFMYGLVRFEILNPLSFLSDKVKEMSLGNLDIDFEVGDLEEKDVGDEIVKVTIAIERLRKSQKAMEKMVEDDTLDI